MALRLVNIPLFLCIRRTTTCFVLFAEYLVLQRSKGPWTMYVLCLLLLLLLV